MPIYEYRCGKCAKKFSVLTLRVSEQVAAECPKCGGGGERLMSRFAMPRSEESRLDSLSDPGNMAGLDENDPRSVSRWMRKMGQEMGDDVSGEDLDEMMSEMESGGGSGGDDDDSGDL